MKKIRILIPLFIFSLGTAPSYAQDQSFLPFIIGDIITASDYFDLVSDQYAQIEDYQALITILQQETSLHGMLYHKRPDLLLLEFEEPEGQVISVDNERLLIYLPKLNVIMHQNLREKDVEGVNEEFVPGATAEGLRLLQEHYSVAFLDTQDFVPLEEGSDELVRNLKLEWRSIDEGFRQLVLSIGEDYLIRRIVGVTAGFEELQIDFEEMVINQNLPEGRFLYDPPPDSNYISDFIFPSNIEKEE